MSRVLHLDVPPGGKRIDVALSRGQSIGDGVIRVVVNMEHCPSRRDVLKALDVVSASLMHGDWPPAAAQEKRMSDGTNDTGAPPAADSVEAAMAERASLMKDPAFREGAVSGRGVHYDRLAGLNRTIAERMDARDAAQEAADADAEADPGAVTRIDPAAAASAALEGDGEDAEAQAAAEAHYNDVPADPAGYDLGRELHDARMAGLPIDVERETALRTGLQQAGVPRGLAKMLYFAAISAETSQHRDRSAVGLQAEYHRAAHELHGKWGKGYEANLALANGEARRIYEAMPDSIKDGKDFRTWCIESGLANNRVIVEQLFNRARARKGSK